MKKTTRRIAVTASATAVFSSALLGSPAQAASLSSEAAAICGSGYYVQRSSVLSDRETQGVTAFQLYNSSSKKNCAVTLKHPTSSSFYGDKTTLGAGIRAEDGSWVKDEGAYAYYAGPVYISAASKCVQFWGKTYQSGASSVWYETYTSPLGNCG
ncbi:serine/threonine protein kinase [Streptomyces sp. NPDC001822]|uniref:serine/threonine protein kinase n=1 Tax=Streptomyces sp. NPDC001822 TaxID=3364614 RepID=UPI00367F0A1F